MLCHRKSRGVVAYASQMLTNSTPETSPSFTNVDIGASAAGYCWFSHDVTKFQTSELLIPLRFYFHDVLEKLKTNIHTNVHSEWVLSLVIDHA